MLGKFPSNAGMGEKWLPNLPERGQYQSRSRLYFALTAVLSFSLVFVGIGLAESHPPTSIRLAQLEHSGSIVITAQNIVDQIKIEGKATFWLGSKSGAGYTLNSSMQNARIIGYLSSKPGTNIAPQSELTIETFDNYKLYHAGLHRVEDPVSRELVMIKNIVVDFNQASMDYEIVTFGATQEVVVIWYPIRQTLSTFMANAQALRRVM